MKDFKPVLKNSKFVSLWSSQLLSQVTINIINFLLLLRLFEKTGSTIATSLLWVAYALPAILIGPFAAASVDMIDRRKILMTTNLLQAGVVFLYAVSHQSSLFLLYGVAVVYSFFNQFYLPAEQASLPTLVPKNSLPTANGVFFATQQAAIILGFGGAGILNRYIGFETSLYLASIFLFAAFIAVSMLPQMKPGEKVPRSFVKAFEKFFERIAEGYLFLKSHYSILAPFLLLMGLQIVLTIVVVNVPLIATQLLKVSIDTAGAFIVVPVGVGTLIGAVLIPKLLKKKWRKKRIIEYSLALLSVTLIAFVFTVPFVQHYWLRIAAGTLVTLLTGLAFIGILIPSQTFIQEKTPGGMRGRVFGNFWFLVTIATIFPAIFSGTISELFGIGTMLIVLSLVIMATLFVFKRFGQRLLAKEVIYGS